nr:hypothetical protein [Azospirillum brasilense]
MGGGLPPNQPGEVVTLGRAQRVQGDPAALLGPAGELGANCLPVGLVQADHGHRWPPVGQGRRDGDAERRVPSERDAGPPVPVHGRHELGDSRFAGAAMKHKPVAAVDEAAAAAQVQRRRPCPPVEFDARKVGGDGFGQPAGIVVLPQQPGEVALAPSPTLGSVARRH